MVEVETTPSAAVTYDIYESKLLPKPYNTKCVNYTERHLDSKGHCFEDCLMKRFLNETGYLHPSLILYGNETDRVVPIGAAVLNWRCESVCLPITEDEEGVKIEGVKDVINRLDRVCEKECSSPDCELVVHNPRKLASGRHEGQSLFAIFAPSTPTIRSESQPAQAFIEFISDVGSSFGFWLGMSAFGLLDFVKDLFGKKKGNSHGKKGKGNATSYPTRSSGQQEIARIDGELISIKKFIDDIYGNEHRILTGMASIQVSLDSLLKKK